MGVGMHRGKEAVRVKVGTERAGRRVSRDTGPRHWVGLWFKAKQDIRNTWLLDTFQSKAEYSIRMCWKESHLLLLCWS
jgi:hypothetical protein